MKERRGAEKSHRYQVFLSYARDDNDIARIIADKLREKGIRTWFDMYELAPSDSLASAIQDAISASDYLIVLLSPNSVESRWVKLELETALAQQFKNRDITLLPVLIADCQIPTSLAAIQYLDLRHDFDHGLDRLAKQIRYVPDIDFSRLKPQLFGNLIADLLPVLGFTNVEREVKIAGKQIDVKALYNRINPFGFETTETWIIEVKFYLTSRADLKSLHQIATYLLTLPEDYKGALITNGQLTSAAREWLESTESKSRIRIQVIDGPQLKRLLLQHEELIDKYFAGQRRNQDECATRRRM
jgi:hypothetical protein